MTDRYEHQDKLVLARKIESLRDMTDIKKIKKIIYENNIGLQKTIDGKEVMMCFHKLTLKTYKEIDQFLKNKKIIKYQKLHKVQDVNTESSSNYYNKDYDDSVTYTNKEKDILRRMNNEKKLK